MKIYFDCLQCFVRQTLDAVRLFTADEKVHEKVLRYMFNEVGNMDFYQSPPEIAQRIHRTIRELLNDNDPYRSIKDSSNRMAMNLFPELEKRIEQSNNPFELALRYAIAGNIIDFGVHSRIEESLVHETLYRAEQDYISPESIEDFKHAVDKADNIVYLGDNCGEIVFDRLLLEQLPHGKITYVVRGKPIINDVTMADARFAGITELVKVIDNGSDAPGTVPEDCSPEFIDLFNNADLIIAKGQGNYESLSTVDKNIYFVFMAKCKVVAQDIGCEVGSFVLKSNSFEIIKST
ncbi:MAG: DUF89 family protein [Candidatus Latescibacteria bacterium]|nr:DUF89 family protein [Candidatus Latescibacterota bacterium]